MPESASPKKFVYSPFNRPPLPEGMINLFHDDRQEADSSVFAYFENVASAAGKNVRRISVAIVHPGRLDDLECPINNHKDMLPLNFDLQSRRDGALVRDKRRTFILDDRETHYHKPPTALWYAEGLKIVPMFQIRESGISVAYQRGRLLMAEESISVLRDSDAIILTDDFFHGGNTIAEMIALCRKCSDKPMGLFVHSLTDLGQLVPAGNWHETVFHDHFGAVTAEQQRFVTEKTEEALNEIGLSRSTIIPGEAFRIKGKFNFDESKLGAGGYCGDAAVVAAIENFQRQKFGVAQVNTALLTKIVAGDVNLRELNEASGQLKNPPAL